MDWKKLIGYGALIWLILFGVICVFVAYKSTGSLMTYSILVVTIVVVYVMAGFVKPDSLKKAASYGFAWVIVGLVLDYLISRKYSPEMYSMWSYWVGYLLVLIVPVLRIKK